MSLTPEQLAERSRGLGGSDAAVVMGLSRFKTPLQLYYEKIGEPRFVGADDLIVIDAELQEWGHLFEGPIIQKYANRTKRTMDRFTSTVWSERYLWMCGHPDAICTSDRRGLEAKTVVPALADEFGEPGSDNVPQDYLLQCVHYRVLTEASGWDLAALISRFDFRVFEIPNDPELEGMLIDAERDFMRRIEQRDPPALNYRHRTAIDVVKKMYPGTTGERVVASADATEWRAKMEAAAKAEKRAKEERDEYRCRLLDEMGDAAILAFPDRKAMRRKLIEKEPYQVQATSYIDTRLINDPFPFAPTGAKRK